MAEGGHTQAMPGSKSYGCSTIRALVLRRENPGGLLGFISQVVVGSTPAPAMIDL